MLLEAMAPSNRAEERETVVVEIQNGTPFEGWGELAASRLNYAGFETKIVPADRQDYGYTTLIELNPVSDPIRNNLILGILGLPPANLASVPDANSSVDYRLVLGSDFQPCFSPETLSH